jgi:ectoine hydroxylase-related dioxygenase (phytanoyl-CoA dioxygenase family)
MQILSISDLTHLTLRREGVAFFPSLLSPSDVADLKRIADQVYDLIEAPIAPPGPNAWLVREVATSSATWGGIPIDHVKSLAEDSSAAETCVSSIIETLARAAAPTSRSKATFRSELSYVRRHRNKLTFAPWHFDALAAGSIKQDPVFNAWVPLVDVGLNCPSLEFVPGSAHMMRSGGFDQKPDEPGFPTDLWMNTHANANHICAVMKPGDIVVFNHYTLHRTQVADFGNYTRTSAEMRFHVDELSWQQTVARRFPRLQNLLLEQDWNSAPLACMTL